MMKEYRTSFRIQEAVLVLLLIIFNFLQNVSNR